MKRKRILFSGGHLGSSSQGLIRAPGRGTPPPSLGRAQWTTCSPPWLITRVATVAPRVWGPRQRQFRHLTPLPLRILNTADRWSLGWGHWFAPVLKHPPFIFLCTWNRFGPWKDVVEQALVTCEEPGPSDHWCDPGPAGEGGRVRDRSLVRLFSGFGSDKKCSGGKGSWMPPTLLSSDSSASAYLPPVVGSSSPPRARDQGSLLTTMFLKFSGSFISHTHGTTNILGFPKRVLVLVSALY